MESNRERERDRGPDAGRQDLKDIPERTFGLCDGEFRVAIERDAYDSVLSHGEADPDREVCGVLVGELCRDADGPFLVVSGAIRGREAREDADHVTFTHSTWERIHEEKEERFPGKRIVGWYHMHPGFGVFLSEVDIFAHRHFFNAAWHIALVVDPKARKEGLFFWQRGDVVRARRYWVGGGVCWEPADRAPATVPPLPAVGVRHATENLLGGRDSAAGTSISRFAFVLAAVAVLCAGFVCFWPESSGRTVDRVAERHDRARLAGDLARSLAFWARERLDRGCGAEDIEMVSEEIFRLDPEFRGTYERLLPEIAFPSVLEDAMAPRRSAAEGTADPDRIGPPAVEGAEPGGAESFFRGEEGPSSKGE
jgi:proteasome lid subunit RPN8/RPN11